MFANFQGNGLLDDGVAEGVGPFMSFCIFSIIGWCVRGPAWAPVGMAEFALGRNYQVSLIFP